MSHPQPDHEDGKPVTTTGAVEVLVALGTLVVAAIFIYDSVRLGFGWREDGPAPGFFPFWIAIILAASSVANLVASFRNSGRGETFVTVPQFGRVLAVLLPTLAYIGLIGGVTFGPVEVPKLGIYLASAIFIFLFMMVIGREGPVRALLVSVGVPIALFFMFEKWFLVPLPKGPIETMLGLN